MKICKAKDRSEKRLEELCNIWEKSVRATHLFLSDTEIKKIAGYVPQALKQIPDLIVVTNGENQSVAFMGIDGNKLEMLFVLPEERRKGIGKQLIRYGIENYAVKEVCVNEQNPQAQIFYERMGFQTYRRTDSDEQGNPYPLLYMRLSE